MHIQADASIDTVWNFGRWFHRAASRPDRLLVHQAGCRRFDEMFYYRLGFG